MKKYLFFILIILSVCKVHPINEHPLNQIPLSLRIKIYLWDHYYKKEWETLLNQLSQDILQKVPDKIKIGQMIHTGLAGTSINPNIEQQLKEFCFGGIIFFKANIATKEDIISLINDFQKKSFEYCKLPLFFSIDQEGGRVVRITEFVTEFPSAMAIGQTNHPHYAWYSGFITGYELSKLGIPLIFAPVADINNNIENPVINTRSFGTNKEIVSNMVRSYIEGINRTSAIGFLKHFPGHGDTNVDSHYNLPVISKNYDQLKELEIVPFEEGIQAGAKGVMVAHILFPELDEYPSTLSKKIITNILKDNLKFNGLIITDAMEMKAVYDRYSIEKASYLSIMAGIDIVLLTAQNQNVDKIYKYLEKNIKQDQNLKNRIYESVKKQIYFKLDSGIFNEDILREHYKVNEVNLELYKRLLTIKKEISEEIYKQIFQTHTDLSYQISYDSIRSLYKDFPKLELSQNSYKIFLQSKVLIEEMEEIKSKYNINTNIEIHIYPKREFIKNIKTLNENEIVIIEIENLEEWEMISKLNIPYRKLLALYSGNPFKKITLKENQYIIASFSPNQKSLISMIQKIFIDNIPASNLQTNPQQKEGER